MTIPFHGNADVAPAPVRAAAIAVDPSLLTDLAAGFQFLHRQLDDAETELERSREQSRVFEQDAKSWQQEAARLRDEAGEMRGALEQLRRAFEAAREGSHKHDAAISRLTEEVAEMRAARTQLEVLAAEQQRALVLSLELLQRSDEGPGAEVAVETGAKDAEIAELKRAIEAGEAERSRSAKELSAARGELEALASSHEVAQAEIRALRAELLVAREEQAATTAALTLARAELEAAREKLDEAERALGAVRARVQELEAEGRVDPQLLIDKLEISQKLQEAEAEIALQNTEVESRGAVIVALETALEEQSNSLRSLEERFLAYAEQVQGLQIEHLEMPERKRRGLVSRFTGIFSPPPRNGKG